MKHTYKLTIHTNDKTFKPFQSPNDLRFVQTVEQYNISTILRFVQTVK